MQRQTFSQPLSLLCIAAPADASLLEQWEMHLLPLQQVGLITFWSERYLQAGTDRMEQLSSRMGQANCIIFFLSADFFASQECFTLMQYALSRQETYSVILIPLLLRPVEWGDGALGSLHYLPTNGRPVTTWPSEDEAFHVCLRELRLLLKLPTRPTRVPNQMKVPANKNRERMLSRLRRSYRELLAQSLQGIPWLALGLTEQSETVQNMTNKTFRFSQQLVQPFPPGTSITRVYEEAEQELLILGEPGSGKSMLLLHLAQHLVSQAELDEHAFLPVILPLSTWAVKQENLAEWMIEQITQTYDIPRKISQEWVQNDQILPLLDGLDEMSEGTRPACIAAINAYHRAHLTPLVVCSRAEEYTRAAGLDTRERSGKARLLLQSAVLIQPLTGVQIELALHSGGEKRAALQAALSEQPALRELAEVPLMLSVLMQTYQGTMIRTASLTATALEQQVWTDYVAHMIERKGSSSRYSLEQTRSWLSWLAQQMQLHSQAIFYAEHLQPDWLAKKLQQVYIRLAIRLPAIILGALASLLIWLFLGQNTDNISLAQVGLLGGYLGGWLSVTDEKQLVSLPQAVLLGKKGFVRTLLPGLRNCLALGVLFGATLGFRMNLDGMTYTPGKWLHDGILSGLCFGISGWIIPLVLHYRSQSEKYLLGKFVPARFLRSRWSSSLVLRRATGIALVWGACYGLSDVLAYGLNYGLTFGLSDVLNYALAFGLASFLLDLVMGNKERTFHLAEHLYWNGWHLIRPSHLRNSLLVVSFIFLVVGLNNGLQFELNNYFSAGLGDGVIFGMNNGLGFGLSVGLSTSLSVGLSYWLLFGLSQGVRQEQVEAQDRRTFNQGIRRSFRNGLLISLLSGGITMSIGILSYGMNSWLSYGLNAWLSYGLTTSSRFGESLGWLLALSGGLLIWATVGGQAVLRHYTIRLLLAWSRIFPWRAQAFLDDATARILLKRQGGGYSFFHRRLLDYFAATTISPTEATPTSERANHTCQESQS